MTHSQLVYSEVRTGYWRVQQILGSSHFESITITIPLLQVLKPSITLNPRLPANHAAWLPTVPALGWPLSGVSSFDLIPKCYRCKCSFLFMQFGRPYLDNPRFLEIWRSNFTSASTSSTPSLFKIIVCSLHHQVLLYSESDPAKILPYVWKPQFHTIPTAQRDSTFLGRQSPPNLQLPKAKNAIDGVLIAKACSSDGRVQTSVLELRPKAVDTKVEFYTEHDSLLLFWTFLEGH